MKRVVRILGILVVLLLSIAIAVPFLIDANQFRPALETRLSAALGRQVQLGDLKLSFFSGGVSAASLTIADDPAFGKQPFLETQSLKIGVKMLPLLLSRRIEVTGIGIDRPQIRLIETPTGVFNFSNIGARPRAGAVPAADASPRRGGLPDLSIAVLRISGGRLALEKTGSKNRPLVLDDLNLEVRNFAPNAPFPFTFSAGLAGGGSLKLHGTAGPIDIGDAANTPFQASLSAAHLDLIRSGLLDPAAGIAGLASVDGAAESAKGVIDVAGKLKAEQLVLAKGGVPSRHPVEVDLVVLHNLARQSGELRKMAVHLGTAVATLSGTYRLATEPATVNLKLAGSGMPMAELASFLPALNIALPSGASIDEGTADVSLSSEGPLDRLVTSGTIGAANVRVAKFDLASKLRVLHEFTGIKAEPHTLIQTLSASVKNTSEGTALNNLQFAIASIGAIAGAGTISPVHALDFRMRAAAGGGSLASLGASGGIPFVIQGTAEDPSIRPDVKGMVSDQIKGFTGGNPPTAGSLLRGLFGGKKKQP